MKTGILKTTLLALVLCATFSVSSLTHAYTVNSHDTVRVGNSGLFLINFSFGHKSRTVQIPTLATRVGDVNNSKAAIEYTITDSNGNVAQGESRGIVLSQASLQKNGVYSTEIGRRATYTLAVLFTPAHTGDTEYTLSVTNLPFMFNENQELKLNPSELQYYKTDALSL